MGRLDQHHRQRNLLRKFEDTNSDGINDRLIIEWNNLQGKPTSPSPLTFQAILQLNTGTTPGAITFNYLDLDAGNAVSDGASATVGIKDTGTQGAAVLVSFNTATPMWAAGRPSASPWIPPRRPSSVTAPGDGTTVSGTVTVTAAATDNVAVAGVQLLLDGANLGAEDTTAPLPFAWDTTSVTAALTH